MMILLGGDCSFGNELPPEFTVIWWQLNTAPHTTTAHRPLEVNQIRQQLIKIKLELLKRAVVWMVSVKAAELLRFLPGTCAPRAARRAPRRWAASHWWTPELCHRIYVTTEHESVSLVSFFSQMLPLCITHTAFTLPHMLPLHYLTLVKAFKWPQDSRRKQSASWV